MTKEEVKVLIIGSGPAGYTAAIYAARAGLKPVLYTGGEPGGQLTTTNDVENFPGYPEGINGPEMMMQLQAQAERFGTEILSAREVASISVDDPYRVVTLDGGEELRCHAVLIATGANYRRLDVPGEEDLIGSGVHFCATCDGPFYRQKHVAVVGGGNRQSLIRHDQRLDISGSRGTGRGIAIVSDCRGAFKIA